MEFNLDGVRLLIFDFDGVIAKKVPNRYPIALFRGLLKDESAFREDATVCFSGTDWIAELELLGIETADREALMGLSLKMFEYYQEEIALYEWVRCWIPEWAKDRKLAILTNNSLASVRQALNGLETHFSAIKGWENVPKLKPAPDGLLCICQELGISPAQTLMVGDSIEDAVAAHRAAARSVTVRSGEYPRFTV
jgi:phosphoglycolate phosphatase